MDKLKYIKLENEDGSYSSSIPLAVDSDHVDVNGNTLTNELSYKANNSSINNLQNQINKLASGSPLVASSTSGMTDTTRIYVNTTDGKWYYYDGDSWEIGGIYQATEDSDTVEELQNDVSEMKSKYFISSNLLDYKIEIVKKVTSDADNTITCTIDDNGILTINGTCSAHVFVMLTDEQVERFPDGNYVICVDNKDYDSLPSTAKYLTACLFRYGHNAYNTYRYNPVTSSSMTLNKTRQEITLVRENVEGFTYDRDGVRFGFDLPNGTYTDVKIRVWLVENGEDEAYSTFGLGDLIGYEKSKTLKLKSDHNLRYAVATDIHWNHDDTVNTGLNGYQKTELLINSINDEHHKKPLDFLLITGDIVETGDKNALIEFKNKYLWKFEMPVGLFPGNHDIVSSDDWKDITGYNRRTSLETEDFYFIFEDTFGDNLGKTWLGHWSSYYQSGDDEAYIPCKSTDTGALLVGTDIQLSSVTPTMRGWNYSPKNDDYVKLAKAKDADMYKPPSLSYVQQEVAKAGDKYIIFVSHMIMGASDGDTEGVKTYLNSLDNFLFYLSGHSHVYTDYHDTTHDKWSLNTGHFFVPGNGWANVASNNYRGFRIIEIDDNKLKTYKIQPTQNVGTQYEHQYNIVEEHNLFDIEKNARADIDLLKLSKAKEYSNKLSDLEARLSDIENVSNN